MQGRKLGRRPKNSQGSSRLRRLKAPLHKTNIQPSPKFAADERASRQMSDKHIPNTQVQAPTPMWQAFQKAMRRKANEATGKDGVPLGLL